MMMGIAAAAKPINRSGLRNVMNSAAVCYFENGENRWKRWLVLSNDLCPVSAIPLEKGEEKTSEMQTAAANGHPRAPCFSFLKPILFHHIHYP